MYDRNTKLKMKCNYLSIIIIMFPGGKFRQSSKLRRRIDVENAHWVYLCLQVVHRQYNDMRYLTLPLEDKANHHSTSLQHLLPDLFFLSKIINYDRTYAQWSFSPKRLIFVVLYNDLIDYFIVCFEHQGNTIRAF